MSTCSSITNYMFLFYNQSKYCTSLQNKTNTLQKSAFQCTSTFHLFTFFALLLSVLLRLIYYIYRFIDAEKFSAQKWLISWWWRQPSELSSNYWPVNQFNFPPAVWPLCKRVWLYQFFRITSFFIIDTVDTRTYETVSLPIRRYFRLISFFYSCFNL